MTCCDQDLKVDKSPNTGRYRVRCLVCGREAIGDTQAQAEANYSSGMSPTTDIATLPNGPADLSRYMLSRIHELSHLPPATVINTRPALTRLITNNCRYVMNRDEPKFRDCWKTEQGQESIVVAIEEALMLACELGKTGSLVPYGGVVEFIPAIEAFEFALTAGNTPLFKWVIIDLIHEHDIVEVGRINGEFTCSIKMGVPRGSVTAVAVYGHFNKTGKVAGEVYDAERLLTKAEAHSQSYKAYLRQVRAFEYARTEGKTGFDAEGREYAMVEFATDPDNKWFQQDVENFRQAEKDGKLIDRDDDKGEYAEVELPKRSGGTWKKKIYRTAIENGTETKKLYLDDITNPYAEESGDQPEMLRKAAGKSFLGKFAKILNSQAAIDEAGGEVNAEAAVDAALDAATRNMADTGPVEAKTPKKAPVNHPPEQEADEYQEPELDTEPEPNAQKTDSGTSFKVKPKAKAPQQESELVSEMKQKVAANKGKDGDLGIF